MYENKIALSPAYRLFRGAGHVIFHNDAHQALIEGMPACLLADMLRKGSVDEETLNQRIALQPDATALSELKEELIEDDLIIRHPAGVSDYAIMQWASMELPFSQVVSRLEAARVELLSAGPDLTAMKEAMALLGINVCDEAPDLTIVLASDWASEVVGAVHQKMQASGKTWMLVAPLERHVSWAVFMPGQTACPCCLVSRRQRYRPVEQWVASQLDAPDHWQAETNLGWPPDFVAQHVALSVLHHLVNRPEKAGDAVLHQLVPGIEQKQTHLIRRLASCPFCGKNEDAAKQPSKDGIEKEPFSSLADPVTGVVTSLDRLSSDGRTDQHIWIANHPLSFNIETLDALRSQLHIHSTGKGRSEERARASAVYEAVERLSGVWRKGMNVRQLSYREAEGIAVHPNALQLFSDDQFAHRVAWNREMPAPLHVPMPLDPDMRIGWVEALNLATGKHVLVPAAYACYDAPDAGRSFCLAHSNGCAAGETRTEAMLNGLYELIERDAVSIWWYNRLVRPGLDLEGTDDPYVLSIMSRYERARRQLWVVNVTHDAGVPVFVALSRSDTPERPDWLMGFGCHIDPSVALVRALAEMDQMAPMIGSQYDMPRLWTVPDGLPDRQLSFLFPDPVCEPATLDSCCPETEGLEPLERILAPLHRLGIDVLAIDQTDPDIGVPVMRVMAPGLYHFWRRLGGKRLTEVPQKMGWTSEEERSRLLNPYSIVL